jgi:hypothetical protein
MLSTAGPSAVPLLVELGVAFAFALTLLLRRPAKQLLASARRHVAIPRRASGPARGA